MLSMALSGATRPTMWTPRRHAELRNEDGNWIVTDLGSTNGVKVNGRRVQEAVLQPGDELAFGLARLRFELE